MSGDSDLPRWRSGAADAPLELARLLSLGGSELGSSDEVAELARRVSAVLGPAAGLPGAASPSDPSPGARELEPPASGPRPSAEVNPSVARSASKLSGSAARWAAWVIGGTGVMAGSWWALSDRSSPPPDPAPLAAALPASVTERPIEAPPPAELPPAPAPQTARDVSIAPEPPAPARPRASVSPRAPAAGSEAQLLARAQAALARRPAEALRLTRQHEARFPRGALAQEREVIAIDALERLGRVGAAKARAAAFERRFHGSVHQPRVQRATDTSAPPGGSSATLPE
jgi:hypothetical protein